MLLFSATFIRNFFQISRSQSFSNSWMETPTFHMMMTSSSCEMWAMMHVLYYTIHIVCIVHVSWYLTQCITLYMYIYSSRCSEGLHFSAFHYWTVQYNLCVMYSIASQPLHYSTVQYIQLYMYTYSTIILMLLL